MMEQIQRRLSVIGFSEPQRLRLQRYRPIVDRVIDRLVANDFERAFAIHAPLRDSVAPYSEAIHAAAANHFRLLFTG